MTHLTANYSRPASPLSGSVASLVQISRCFPAPPPPPLLLLFLGEFTVSTF